MFHTSGSGVQTFPFIGNGEVFPLIEPVRVRHNPSPSSGRRKFVKISNGSEKKITYIFCDPCEREENIKKQLGSSVQTSIKPKPTEKKTYSTPISISIHV